MIWITIFVTHFFSNCLIIIFLLQNWLMQIYYLDERKMFKRNLSDRQINSKFWMRCGFSPEGDTSASSPISSQLNVKMQTITSLFSWNLLVGSSLRRPSSPLAPTSRLYVLHTASNRLPTQKTTVIGSFFCVRLATLSPIARASPGSALAETRSRSRSQKAASRSRSRPIFGRDRFGGNLGAVHVDVVGVARRQEGAALEHRHAVEKHLAVPRTPLGVARAAFAEKQLHQPWDQSATLRGCPEP